MNKKQNEELEVKVTQNPLGHRPIGKLLFSFALPAIVACLINSVYNIVDQIFIGQGVGYLGNAATTVAFPVVIILMAFSTLIGSGSSAYAALKLGEGDAKAAKGTLNNALLLCIFISVLAMVLGIVFLEPILKLFGASDPKIMEYAKDYTGIILLGAPFSVIGTCLSSIARTDGSPNLSMYGILIGAVLNTILDPIYIFVFHWGVKGAAIATVTSQMISFIILFVYFVRSGKRPDHMRFDWKYLKKPNLRIIKKIVVLGISSGIASGIACVMQVIMNNSLVRYGDMSPIGGDVALSAMGIVSKIAMILASVAIGIGIGVQPVMGFNMGAQNYYRVKKSYITAVVSSTISLAICWLMCQLFPHMILSLFGSGNPEFNKFAVMCLRINLFGIFCVGFQIVSTTYFQATGQALKASLLSTLRQLLILIPLLLILPLFFGLEGVLYATPIADLVSTVIVILFIIPEMKKLNKEIYKN